MKTIEEHPVKLSDLFGIGTKIQQQLLAAFPNEQSVIDAIQSRDIAAFTRNGFKKSFAIRIIRQALSEGYKMLLSPDGRELYRRIVELLKEYPQIKDVKDRISTLVPNYWGASAEDHLAKVLKFRDTVTRTKPVEMDKVIKALASVDYRPLNAPELPAQIQVITTSAVIAEKWTGKIAVQVVNSVEEMQERARETPFLRILSDDLEAAPEGSVILPTNAATAEIFPELIVRRAIRLTGHLQAYLAGAQLDADSFPLAGELGETAKILAQLEESLRVLDEGKALLENSIDAVEADLRKLESEEVSSDEVAKLFKKHANDENFLMEFDTVPIKGVREIVDFSIARHIENKIFTTCRKSVKKLTKIISNSKEIIAAVQDLDYWLSLGRFAVDYDLVSPEINTEGNQLYFEGGRHLFLYHQWQQKTLPRLDTITYVLGPAPNAIPGVDGEKITLLTGANSGGKTCLLETIFYIVLLPHMGLPVPAKVAHVPAIKGIFFHRRHFAKSAGALEGTLKRLMPAFSKAAHNLILVDEFEAITEPGAAARILSGLINILADQATLAVFVTHLSNEIVKVVGPVARLDAIQAAGLDRNLELITDHQPIFGQIGRSTPELIVQKLLKSTKSKSVQKNYQSLQNTLAAGQVTWQTRIDWFIKRREHRTGNVSPAP